MEEVSELDIHPSVENAYVTISPELCNHKPNTYTTTCAEDEYNTHLLQTFSNNESFDRRQPTNHTGNNDLHIFEDFYFKVEMGEWYRINRAFQDHGLKQVEVLHPNLAQQAADVVQFSTDMSRILRENVESLFKEIQRKQDTINEMVTTINRQSEELDAQSHVSERFKVRTEELHYKLTTANEKIQSLEFELNNLSIGRDHDSDKLRGMNSDLRDRVLALQRLNDEKGDKIDDLQEKLDQLRQKFTRQGSPDETIRLVASQVKKAADEDKALIKIYEKDVRECRKKIKALESDLEVAKLEAQSRPSFKDYRNAQLHIQRLQAACRKHQKRVEVLEAQLEESNVGSTSYGTSIEDIDQLPISYCRATIKLLCQELGVSDVAFAVKKLKETTQSTEATVKLQKFACQVVEICNNMPQSQGDLVSKVWPAHDPWCDKTTQRALQTLNYWQEQGQALQQLHVLVKKLGISLVPWRPTIVSNNTDTSVRAMCRVVEAILNEHLHPTSEGHPRTKRQLLLLEGNSKKEKEQASREELQAIVEHYMTLFDVHKIQGCYASMNDVYRRIEEGQNVLKNLKELLDLEKSCKNSDVVSAVQAVLSDDQQSEYKKLLQALPQNDLDSIIRKVKIHDEFFPIMRDVIQATMDIVNVSRLDQLVPAVRSLKINS